MIGVLLKRGKHDMHIQQVYITPFCNNGCNISAGCIYLRRGLFFWYGGVFGFVGLWCRRGDVGYIDEETARSERLYKCKSTVHIK